jgi:hypothetical protein
MMPMTSSRTTRSIRKISFHLAVLFFLVINIMAHAQSSSGCRRWIAKVTKGGQSSTSESKKSPTPLLVPEADPWDVASLSEAEKLQAIECLLTLENDVRPAAFGGAVRMDISQTFAPPHVNLAALYAISYIYDGRFDHAAAVALRGKGASTTDASGNYTTRAVAIHKAYRAYRAWFAKVRKLGTASAHAAGLEPLAGSGLMWY